MNRFLLTLFAAISLTLPTMAQDDAWKPGEKINYTVFYSVMGLYVNAGTASFTTSSAVHEDRNVYHVVGEGRTNPSYDWIFKVRDRYETFIDQESKKPVKFIRNVHEGNYKRYEEVVFDHGEKAAVTKKGIYKIPNEVQDVVSSLYYARNLDYDKFKPNDKIHFNMFLGDEVYDMYIRYVGKETIKTKFGTYRAIKLKPLLIKGNVFEGGEKMTVWVTDDANHIPVRIESDLSVGKVKVDLNNHKNLKYPLTSLATK